MSPIPDSERLQLPVELKINGQSVRARPGQTILEVVREQGLDEIPTLCYDPKLEYFGSCFLCVVEVKGARGLLPSCTTRIRDGMEVFTRSERISNTRKTALELLLSDHYADCTCPAQRACPAGVDVQGYLGLARLGHYEEALRLIKERNPLPIVCGRVCVRKCEVKCRRNEVDKPVGINYVKRYCAEHSRHEAIRPQVKPATGKRVAVVGGGPAGLTCAYYLSLLGHSVKIFEAMPRLGGMLRYGIPEYRLPKAELDKEISEILQLGTEVVLEKKLGRDFTVESLLKQDQFQAVFLTPGAPLSQKLDIPGEEAEGIESALDFLRDTELEGPRPLRGKTVVVVGGGNVAVDGARTALRCGAKQVTILYRRTRKEMPAHHEEVDAAEQEGVRLEMLAAPVEVIAQQGRLQGLRCIKMELGEPDASGRRRPVPIPGSEFDYPCDYVLSAIGQKTEPEVFGQEPETTRPAISRRGTIQVDEATMATDRPGVFAGGDAVSGPAVVIDAIAQGHRAADAIHQYLLTGEMQASPPSFVSQREVFGPIPARMFEEVERIPRQQMPERLPEVRRQDFAAVELGLSQEEMEAEANRCLECGCKAQFECALRRYATEYNVDIMKMSGAVRRHKVDNSHPLITLDPNKCILCGRCVRTCADILNQSILGFVNRGFTSQIKPALGKPLAETPCISCGACVETCPTGALTAKLPYGRQGPWKVKQFPSVCGFCSVGCSLSLNVVTEGVLWATSQVNSHPGQGDLCWKGRFGTGLIQGPDRLRQPLVRKNGQLEETDWDEAIKEAARLLQAVRNQKGPESVAVLAAPRMTLEECYLVGRLARAGLGTDQIGSFGQIYRGGPRQDLDDLVGETTSTCSREDIDSADVIWLVGADPSSTHPVISMRVRRAARRGAKIIVVNSSNIDLVRSSRLWLDPRRGTLGILLAGLLRRIMDRSLLKPRFSNFPPDELRDLRDSLANATLDEVSRVSGVEATKIDEVADLLTTAKKVVAIYDLQDTMESAPDDLTVLTLILILMDHLTRLGSGLLLLQPDCNSEGARLVGMREGVLPGGYPISNQAIRRRVEEAWKVNLEGLVSSHKGNLFGRLVSGEIAAALVLLQDPFRDPEANRILGKLEALVVVDLFLTETAKMAQVVLPAATLAESQGTVVSFDRRVQAVTQGNSPPGGLTTAEVIGKLSQALGHPLPSLEAGEIRRELSVLIGISPERLEKARVEWEKWPDSGSIPQFQRLKKIQLASRLSSPVHYPDATMDSYLQRRLTQMGMFR